MRVTTALITALPLLVCSAAAAPGFQFPFTKKPQQHDDAFPGRGEVIDLSKYTIGQILNYTLYHHRHDDHDHDHEQCRQDNNGMARIFEEHRRTPPLVKLAWVVNRTDAVSGKDLSHIRPFMYIYKAVLSTDVLLFSFKLSS